MKFKTFSLGKDNDSGQPVRISPDIRSTHMHVIGSTGEGKSKFLEHMIREDIKADQGLCLIDPHGYLYEDLVRWCETKGFLDWHNPKKIILFEPGAEGWTFGFNPLKITRAHISTHVDAMVKAVAAVWGGEDTDRTPLLKRCLRSLFYVLAEKNLSLAESRFLYSPTEDQARQFLTRELKDPEMQGQWDYFNQLKPKPFYDEFGSTINRMMEFMASPLVRTIVGQIETTIDFREIMDNGHVLLVNLAAADKISEDNARLLGTLIVNDLFMKAKGRPQGSRPFYFYIDECSLFVNQDVRRILDEGRKFGLHLILAHQHLSQLREAGENVYSAVMTSAKTKVIFGGLSAEDARVLAEQVFLGELDLEEEKKTLRPTQVKGYITTWLESYSRGSSHAEGIGSGRSSGFGSTSGSGEAVTLIPGGILGDAQVATVTSASQGASRHTLDSEGWSSSDTESESWGRHQALQPVLGEGPGPGYTLEEQIHKAMALMVNQPQRHAIIKLPKKPTVFAETPFIQPGIANETRTQEFKSRCYQLAPFANPRHAIEVQIQERQVKLLSQFSGKTGVPRHPLRRGEARKEEDFWEKE